jgi:hypothetical protein
MTALPPTGTHLGYSNSAREVQFQTHATSLWELGGSQRNQDVASKKKKENKGTVSVRSQLQYSGPPMISTLGIELPG